MIHLPLIHPGHKPRALGPCHKEYSCLDPDTLFQNPYVTVYEMTIPNSKRANGNCNVPPVLLLRPLIVHPRTPSNPHALTSILLYMSILLMWLGSRSISFKTLRMNRAPKMTLLTPI